MPPTTMAIVLYRPPQQPVQHYKLWMQLNEHNSSTTIYLEQIQNFIELATGYNSIRQHLFAELNRLDQPQAQPVPDDRMYSPLTQSRGSDGPPRPQPDACSPVPSGPQNPQDDPSSGGPPQQLRGGDEPRHAPGAVR